VLGYGAIFPEVPLVAGLPEGCWPSIPVSPDDVGFLGSVEKSLNAMIAQQVTDLADANAKYVDIYSPSIGHDACEPPAIRWIEPAIPASPAAPIHPNLFGMQADAAILAAAISSSAG